MKEMEEKLKGMNFCRGNKGYLINLQHVDGIQDGCATVKGEQLVLSRARKKEFMEELTKYWGEIVNDGYDNAGYPTVLYGTCGVAGMYDFHSATEEKNG